jgi:hypothetical protein
VRLSELVVHLVSHEQHLLKLASDDAFNDREPGESLRPWVLGASVVAVWVLTIRLISGTYAAITVAWCFQLILQVPSLLKNVQASQQSRWPPQNFY